MQTLTNPNNYGATLAEAEHHLRNWEPFHTGTLSAKWERFDDILVYVVRSYGVEIAASSTPQRDRAVLDEAYDYSRTTARHANLVKKAWGI